jgi:hypothetical protein
MSRVVFTVQSLLFIGLGVIAGYGIFFILWKTQCGELLNTKELLFNGTLVTLQNEQAELLTEVGGCSNDRHLSQMQGLLDKQTTLASRYQDLLEKHEETLSRLDQVQKQGEGSSQLVHSLNDQINHLQSELGESTVQAEKNRQQGGRQLESLKSQLELSKSMLREKIEEVKHTKSDGSCTGTTITDGGDLDGMHQLQAALRRRNTAQCLTTHGEGPYRVEFTLDMPGIEDATFQVEFGDLRDMPHTIWTFLSLVDVGLYDGTTLGAIDDEVTGGDPLSGTKKIQSLLTRQYAEHGHGSDPLMFEENSPRAPCSQFTFGILGKGPQISIPMIGDSPVGKFISRSCPGTIVHGKDTLKRLEQLQKRATIQRVRIIRRGNDQRRRDEL